MHLYPALLASLLRSGNAVALGRELWQLPRNFPNSNTKSRFLLTAWMLQALLPAGIKQWGKPELRGMDGILRSPFRQRMRSRDIDNLRLLDPPGLEEKMQHDLLACNVPQYLRYEDANAMAFGIEERVPMLDHRLVEWAHGLAVQWKVRDGVTKHALRQTMRGVLPEEVVQRRDKMGLSAPRDPWFRGELRPSIETLFGNDCRIYGEWIERQAFLGQLQQYLDGRPTPLARLLWRCINLEKWLRCYTV